MIASATGGDIAVAFVIMLGLVVICGIICFTVYAYYDKRYHR